MRSLQAAERRPSTPPVNLKALNYENDHVVARLVTEHEMTREDAEVLFADTLKFLALTEGGQKLSPPARIDLGWHNFILHTPQYAKFCNDAFGHFIHHEPGSGLTGSGERLDVHETTALAHSVFGDLSPNWDNVRGATCGSGGC